MNPTGATKDLEAALTRFGRVKPRDKDSGAELAAGKDKVRSAIAKMKPDPVPDPAPSPEPPPVTPAPLPDPPPPVTSAPAPDIGIFTQVSDFPENLCKPGRAKMVPDPAGSGREVISLECQNADTGVTENPRAQLGTKYLLVPESEFWLRTRIWFPEDFPTFKNWMTLLSVWAPPFGGDGAPAHLNSWDGKTLNVERNSNHGDDTPLKMPIVRGQWTEILWHEYLSRDPAKGYVEIWRDGIPQTFISSPGNPTQRLKMATIDNTNSGGNQNVRLDVYYAHNAIPGQQPVTVLFDGLYIGSSRESVGA